MRSTLVCFFHNINALSLTERHCSLTPILGALVSELHPDARNRIFPPEVVVMASVAAYRFLLKALGSSGVPKNLTMDKSGANKAAANAFVEDVSSKHQPIEIRQVKYLNNILEQDHRGVKRRIGPMLGFKSFLSAQRKLAGVELVHMLRKGQHEKSSKMSSAEVFYRLAG